MKKTASLRSGRQLRVLGVLLVTAALLTVTVSSGKLLRAVQDEAPQEAPATDESAAAGDSEVGLRVPGDITEESIEKVDEAVAAKLGPSIRVLFDGSASVADRRAAAAEIRTSLAELSPSTPGSASVRRRVLRRVELLSAAFDASEIPNVLSASSEALASAASAAQTAHNWLNTVPNGSMWVDYLHLAELEAGTAPLALLQQVSRNLTPGENVSAEQSEFMTRGPLTSLKSAVDSAAAAAAYEGDDTAARAELHRQLHDLVLTVLSYEKDQLSPDAEKLRGQYRTLRTQFPAAGRIMSDVLLDEYFNHNIHFTVSESLLSRLVSDYRSETGCIADCIMGAWVTGSQVTDVNVYADIRPSTTTARFALRVDGHTTSNTSAHKDPATVFTRGNHYFNIEKIVDFDGRHVSARRGTIGVNANNTTVGLRTDYDGIPIIGSIVRKIAMGEVNKSKAQSESLAASRIADEALPKIESETATQFSDANSTLDKLLDSLDQKGVAPDSISARSSNTHIAVSSRTIGDARIGGSTQPPVVLSSRGVAIQVHESALNNALDALGFNGRTIAEDQVNRELEAALSDLLQRDISFKGKQTEPAATPAAGEEVEPTATFVFSHTDPIRVHFEDNQIILTLRMGVNQDGKDPIPEQIIRVPIAVAVAGGNLILEPGNIGVSSREESSRALQVLRANQIRRILNRRFQREEVDGTFDLQAAGDRSLMMTLASMELSDGWLSVELQ